MNGPVLAVALAALALGGVILALALRPTPKWLAAGCGGLLLAAAALAAAIYWVH